MIQWIKVEDRLPERTMSVWVSMAYKDIRGAVSPARFRDGDDTFIDYDSCTINLTQYVTHWMPMQVPEPPEEG
jgi:hypothetical protein